MKRELSIIGIVMMITILVIVGLDKIIIASDVINEKYNINVRVAAIFFLISEILFNIGIFVILKGSGIFKIGFKQLRSFRLKTISFRSRQVYIGFLINRLAAIIPWLYIVIAGWGVLPTVVVLAIFAEISIVVLIGFLLPFKNKKRIYV